MFDSIKEKLFSSSKNSQNAESEQTDDSDGTAEHEGDASSFSISTTEKAKKLLRGKRVLDEDELETHLSDLRLELLNNNVAIDVADEITATVKEELYGETERVGKTSADRVQSAVKDALVDVLSRGQNEQFFDVVESSEKPLVVMFTGVNGVGKTTTIAKIAKQLEEEGYSSVIANGDTYRAGATEQMKKHADALDKKVISHEQGSDPTAVLYDAVEYAEANDIDVVLGDTAGRLHTSNDLMEQLDKMERVVEPDKTIFVDEAVAGQDAINRAQEFDEAASIDGIILTKADADESGGAILSLPYLLEKPVYYLGTGQGYSDVSRFDSEQIASNLLNED